MWETAHLSIFPLDLPLRLLERPEGARAKARQVHHASAEHRPRLGPFCETGDLGIAEPWLGRKGLNP